MLEDQIRCPPWLVFLSRTRRCQSMWNRDFLLALNKSLLTVPFPIWYHISSLRWAIRNPKENLKSPTSPSPQLQFCFPSLLVKMQGSWVQSRLKITKQRFGQCGVFSLHLPRVTSSVTCTPLCDTTAYGPKWKVANFPIIWCAHIHHKLMLPMKPRTALN